MTIRKSLTEIERLIKSDSWDTICSLCTPSATSSCDYDAKANFQCAVGVAINLSLKPDSAEQGLTVLKRLVSWYTGNWVTLKLRLSLASELTTVMGCVTTQAGAQLDLTHHHQVMQILVDAIKRVKKALGVGYLGYGFHQRLVDLKEVDPVGAQIVMCLAQAKRAITAGKRKSFREAVTDGDITRARALSSTVTDAALLRVLFKKPDAILLFLDDEFNARIKKLAEKRLAQRTADELTRGG